MKRYAIVTALIFALVFSIGAAPATVPMKQYRKMVISRNYWKARALADEQKIEQMEWDMVQDRMSDGQYINFLEGENDRLRSIIDGSE